MTAFRRTSPVRTACSAEGRHRDSGVAKQAPAGPQSPIDAINSRYNMTKTQPTTRRCWGIKRKEGQGRERRGRSKMVDSACELCL